MESQSQQFTSQEHNFDADISQLMNLIVNAFYSTKEIFVRELLSNSSDALEKLRYESLLDKSVLDSNSDLKIKVSVNSENNTISIEDSGIGMTRNDLINNLGTIARSGTKNFLDNLKSGDNSIDQIGQFGVGFYSSFLVADKVVLFTKHNDECEYVWESTADKSYTITENTDPVLKRGTRIVLYVKEDQKEYLDINNLKTIIKKYTQFINYPIELEEHREIEEEVEISDDDSGDEDGKEMAASESVASEAVASEAVASEAVASEAVASEAVASEAVASEAVTSEAVTSEAATSEAVASEATTSEEVESEAATSEEVESESATSEAVASEAKEINLESGSESNKKTKKIKKTITEWNVVNEQKPIWCRKSEDITSDEYQSFYKSISNDSSDALVYKHFQAEGQLEFKCLLYIPERPQHNMFQTGENKKNIKLYVKKIFIMDDCKELCPEWLKFVQGIVDSNDIPLNVSRELLQQNKVLKQIKKVIIKKSIELFNEIAEDDEKYVKFYNNYSKMIKLGVHEDNKNRDKLMKLLRYYSSNSQDEYISLDSYVEKMSDDQDKIYYITGQNKQSLVCSPFIEQLKLKGYNVLFFTDPIDEYMVQSVKTYSDKKLVDVSKEGIKFDEEGLKKKEEENKELIKFLKDTLGDRVQNVKISDRLKDTPCVLVTAEYGWSANMERILKAQALRNDQMDQFMGAKKIFEINLDHKIMRTLKEKMSDKELVNQCKDITFLLYDTAQINSGFTLDKPSDYANKVNRMVELGFCGDIEDDEEDVEDELPDLDEDIDDEEDNDMEQVD